MRNTASFVPMVLFLVLAVLAMILFVAGIVEASVVSICCFAESAIKYSDACEEAREMESKGNLN